MPPTRGKMFGFGRCAAWVVTKIDDRQNEDALINNSRLAAFFISIICRTDRPKRFHGARTSQSNYHFKDKIVFFCSRVSWPDLFLRQSRLADAFVYVLRGFY